MLKIIGCIFIFQGVKDSMNYGFYDPPCNGKSGKFLEEERPFKDYPLSGTPPVLEVCKYTLVFYCAKLKPSTLSFWQYPFVGFRVKGKG